MKLAILFGVTSILMIMLNKGLMDIFIAYMASNRLVWRSTFMHRVEESGIISIGTNIGYNNIAERNMSQY